MNDNSASQTSKAPQELVELLKRSKKHPVILVFVAEWLGSADMYIDFVRLEAKEVKIEDVEIIDIDRSTMLTSYLLIEQLPTTLVLSDNEILDRFSGVYPRHRLQERITRLLNQ